MKYVLLLLLTVQPLGARQKRLILHRGQAVNFKVYAEDIGKPVGAAGLLVGHTRFTINGFRKQINGFTLYGTIPDDAEGEYILREIVIDYEHGHILLTEGADFPKYKIKVVPR